MRRTAAPTIRRLVVRTGEGPLRPLWVAAYTLLARAIALLLRGDAYSRGSLASGDLRPGLSDLDLAVVSPDAPAVRRRWERLGRLLPPLRRLVDLAVYEPGELQEAVSCSTLRARRALHLAPHPPPDDAGLRLRPGLGPLADWRALNGARALPAAPDWGPHERRDAAWLELQFVWRWALGACARPTAADLPYLGVKLVSDPVRIWLWLVHAELPPTRRAVLERGIVHIPEEEPALREALTLIDGLARGPRAALERTLPAAVRLSARLARSITGEAFAHGSTEVALRDGELALRADAPGGLLPLADWRSRAWPQYPDDAFFLAGFDPADPDALGDAVRAGGDIGPFPASIRDGLLVLAGPGILRAVQCEATDPVSFALADGREIARFPEVPGWSASDSARRAVMEHRSWLGAEGSSLGDWLEAQDRTTAPEIQVFGWLLSAARAALFRESVERDDPVLPLTMAAAAESLGSDAEEAYAVYRECRCDHRDPPAPVVGRLREAVLALPAYAFDELEGASARA